MTADDIRARVMAQGGALGLKLRLRTPDGETTLYPKDAATFLRWRDTAQCQGWQVLPEEVTP
jgi:hypothetical protein